VKTENNVWFCVLGHFVVGVELGDLDREVAPVTDGLDAHMPPRRRWVLEHHDMRHGNVFHVYWSYEEIGILLCAACKGRKQARKVF